jgi:cysteinyl-tRNA synthetase
MALPRLYNTLTRRTEELVLREPGRATVYCCGPTVYDVPHVGHGRAALSSDILVRQLRAHGIQVTYARNVTDIDDKILERAKRNGETPLELSRRMAEIYQQQMRAIGCLDPDHEPRVSDHLPQIHRLIEKILAHGGAYVLELPDGKRDVYFSVRSFAGYGKLSRRKIDDLLVGARVEADESKHDPLDFALWKGVGSDEWGWDSPWGRGRPGWHIECSAMSTHCLGHGFDVHCGGMDLIFPHHENEIAQSEAAEPDLGPMVRVWIHNGFVTVPSADPNVEDEKMAKSLGNFFSVPAVLERNDPEGFRWFLLGVHYRGPLRFEIDTKDGRPVFPGVDEAERRVDYLYATTLRLNELAGLGLTAPAKSPPELSAHRDAIARALEQGEQGLDDDLNTPVALASLGELARIGNEVCDLAAKRKKDAAFTAAASVVARAALSAIEKLSNTLGVLGTPPSEYMARTRERRIRLRNLSVEAIDEKVEERNQARRDKDFQRGDAIRSELSALGISLRDSATGTEWSIEQ